MPWCENEGCNKSNLKKSEVIFDEHNKKVLCVPCGQQASLSDQALVGEVIDKTWFGVGYTSDQGLKAELVYQGAKVSLNVSNDQIQKLIR